MQIKDCSSTPEADEILHVHIVDSNGPESKDPNFMLKRLFYLCNKESGQILTKGKDKQRHSKAPYPLKLPALTHSLTQKAKFLIIVLLRKFIIRLGYFKKDSGYLTVSGSAVVGAI